MSTWTQIQASWTAGWKAMHAESLRLYDVAIRADPARFQPHVEAFWKELNQVRELLDGMRARLPEPVVTAEDQALRARLNTLERRYQDLAAGLFADASAVQTTVGVAPIVVGVIIAGVLIGVAGIAWAVAAYEYAVNLREQTALASHELDARVEASEQGRTLQPSTVPPQSDPVKQAQSVGWLLAGGLALTAAAVAVPMFLKRKAG